MSRNHHVAILVPCYSTQCKKWRMRVRYHRFSMPDFLHCLFTVTGLFHMVASHGVTLQKFHLVMWRLTSIFLGFSVMAAIRFETKSQLPAARVLRQNKMPSGNKSFLSYCRMKKRTSAFFQVQISARKWTGVHRRVSRCRFVSFFNPLWVLCQFQTERLIWRLNSGCLTRKVRRSNTGSHELHAYMFPRHSVTPAPSSLPLWAHPSIPAATADRPLPPWFCTYVKFVL